MKTFPLTISSPDGDLFRGDVEMLIVLAVMAGHVPFVTAVVRGKCAVILSDSERKEGIIEEGLLTVDPDQVTVLTSALEFE